MLFQHPLFLWSLSALLLPVFIHLWNRQKPVLLRVATVRFIETLPHTRFRNVRLKEIPLLLLRLLLLTIFTLLLAGAFMEQSETTVFSRKKAFVERALLDNVFVKEQLKKAEKAGYTLHLSEKDFPVFNLQQIEEKLLPPTRNSLPKDYWIQASLIDRLSDAPDEALMLVRPEERFFQSPRPQTYTQFIWVPLPDAKDQLFLYSALRNHPDSLTLCVGQTEESGNVRYTFWKVKTQNILELPRDWELKISLQGDTCYVISQGESSLVPVQVEYPPLSILLLASTEFEGDKKILKAAIEALGEYLNIPLEIKDLSLKNINSALIKEASTVFWLAEEKPPAFFFDIEATSHTRRIFYALFNEKSLISPLSNSGLYRLNKRLLPEENPEMLTSALPEALLHSLLKPYRRLPENALRPLSSLEMQTDQKSEKRLRSIDVKRSQSLHLPLWIGLVLLLLAERWWSAQRKY